MLVRFIFATILVSSSFVSFGQTTSFPKDPETSWRIHTDTVKGYTIQFPSKWVGTAGKGGFVCGEKAGFRDAKWSVIVVSVDDEERKEMLFGKQELTTGIFEGLKTVETEITLDGFEAKYFLETNDKFADWYTEYIYIKTDKYWFSISNVGEKDERFKQFYESFQFIK